MTAAGSPQLPGAPLPPEVLERLLDFLCAVAWVDNAIQPQERLYFQRLLQRLGADGPQTQQLLLKLQRPSAHAALDITTIPVEHRRRFLAEAERVAAADGRVTPAEKAILDRLRKAILRGR